MYNDDFQNLNPNPMAPPQMSAPSYPQLDPRQMAAPYNSYARGGRPHRRKLQEVHMNKNEMDILDHLQGKIERCPKSNARSYSHLEELISNPHILSTIHQHSRKYHGGGHPQAHYAHGGHAYAEDGVHGDHEIALIGPRTKHLFDRLATNHRLNPYDGHPQYWSLGGALGGLWDTLKSGAQKVAPYIGEAGNALLPSVLPAIEGAATAEFGPMGGMAAQGLGNLASKGFNALSQVGGGFNPTARAGGEALNEAFQARRAGSTPMQSFGAGVNRFGSRMNGPVGGAVQGFGQSMMNNNNWRQTAMNMGRGAYQGAGGAQGLQDTARQALTSYQSGMSPAAIGSGMIKRTWNSMMPQQDPYAQYME